MRGRIALLACLAALAATPAVAQKPPEKGEKKREALLILDATPMPLGTLPPQLWAGFRARFVTDQGRVVDTANRGISHSEGQGYGMLLAVAARDQAGFERIWHWTRANLLVRDDQLVAWRWEPNARPAVADTNNATDGDILIAWALVEAAELWGNDAYRAAARRIAVEVGRKLVVHKTQYGSILLPGIAGFAAEERKDGPVVNLSYWVFPAFSRLQIVAPEIGWSNITQSGLDLLKAARLGPASLPSDWVSLAAPEIRAAEGFPAYYGYNNMRIALYMAWAGVGTRDHYAPFVALWNGAGRGGLAIIDTGSGRVAQPLNESGFAAIPALTQCAVNATPLPRAFLAPATNENYYPSALHLLSIVAAQMRYRSCMQTQ